MTALAERFCSWVTGAAERTPPEIVADYDAREAALRDQLDALLEATAHVQQTTDAEMDGLRPDRDDAT